MTKRIFATLALVFALAALSACGKNPTGPTTQTCQDPTATNNGGPLPCTYPTLTQTYVKLLNTVPGDGATLKADTCPLNTSCGCPGNGCSYVGDEITSSVEYGMTQADMDAVQTGDRIIVNACLSINGTDIVGRRPGDVAGGACFGQGVPSSGHGTIGISHLTVHRSFSPDVTKTSFIIVILNRVNQCGDNSCWQSTTIATKAFPVTFYWQ